MNYKIIIFSSNLREALCDKLQCNVSENYGTIKEIQKKARNFYVTLKFWKTSLQVISTNNIILFQYQ